MPHDSQVRSAALPPSTSFSRRLLAALILALWVGAGTVLMAKGQPPPPGPSTAALKPTQDDKNTWDLKPGRPVVREMSAGETHVYRLALSAGQYAQVVFDQQGIDVSVTLSDSDGAPLNKFDSLDGARGSEHVWIIAESTGTYELRVRPSAGDAKPGRYAVRIKELREATKKDRENVIAQYEAALRAWQARHDEGGESMMLYNIGQLYTLTDSQKALEYFEKALPGLRRLGNSPVLAATLNGVGILHAKVLNDLARGLKYYEDALSVLMALHDRPGEAAMRNNIGDIYYSMGQEANARLALQYYKQALDILRPLGDSPTLPVTLSNIGLLLKDYPALTDDPVLKGAPQRPLDYFEEALSFNVKLHDRLGEAITRSNLALLYLSEGHKEKAAENYREALRTFQSVGDYSNEIIVRYQLGLLYDTLGRKQEAIDLYDEGLLRLEVIRASSTVAEFRSSLAEAIQAYVYRMCQVLISTGQAVRAFELTERARSRALLDRLNDVSPAGGTRGGGRLSPEEQALEAKLSTMEQELRRERSRASPDLNYAHVSSLKAQYDAAQREYEELLLSQSLANKRKTLPRSAATLTLPRIQRLLDGDVTLLSYFVGPDESWAFVITRDSFKAVSLPVKEEDLIKPTIWVRRFPNTRNLNSEPLKQLYDWLIAPVEQYIKTRRVGIIPHRYLYYVPFAALTDGRRYFAEGHALFNLPSASVLRFIRKKQGETAGARMLAVAQSGSEGSPLLQHADTEVKAVADLYATQPLTAGQATKAEFMKRAGEYGIIHIAAHAVVDTYSPLFYHIVLGAGKDDSGLLSVREIYNLNLAKTNLVVLSACQTELGGHRQGDDIVALNRAFMYAGAPSVIASLWTVDDESTSYLMVSFYRHLKGGMGKAEALSAAQAETRQKFPHPYYWAGFVLTGDPGRISRAPVQN